MADLDRFSHRMWWERNKKDEPDDDRLPFDEIICPYCDKPEEYCECP